MLAPTTLAAIRIAAVGLALAAGCLAQQTPVILISIDTLRADHLSAYGYTKIRTPNIDALSQQGTVFTAIDSQIPLTLPSHTSLFTSTYPFANGIEENGQRLPDGAVTLASVLRAHGYQTAAFVGSVLLDRRTGIAQGFDTYDSPFHLPEGGGENPYGVRVRRDGALVVRAARQWLEAHRNQPVFAFLHFFDLHTPYSVAPGPDALPRTAGYDAELAYIDRLLGGFRQALVAEGWWDRSLVVLLSDHGESLGDHGETSHGYFIYQSTVWVPLIVHWPAGKLKLAARVTQPGGLIDVAPMILDFLGVPRPPSFSGESLLQTSASHIVYSESTYTRDAFGWAPLRSLRDTTFQYIEAPKPELYNLQADPQETNNLASIDAGPGRPLRDQLDRLIMRFAPHSGANAASSQTNALLGSLGYVGSGPHIARSGPMPDPKDRLPEYDVYETALAALYAGNPAGAIRDLRGLLKDDPQNTLAHYYVGEAYLRAHQSESAVREWTATLKTDPTYVPAEEALAEVWMAREDYARARGYYQQALAAAPLDFTALLGAGIAEKHLGMLPEARKHLEAACAIDPESTRCRNELAGVGR